MVKIVAVFRRKECIYAFTLYTIFRLGYFWSDNLGYKKCSQYGNTCARYTIKQPCSSISKVYSENEPSFMSASVYLLQLSLYALFLGLLPVQTRDLHRRSQMVGRHYWIERRPVCLYTRWGTLLHTKADYTVKAVSYIWNLRLYFLCFQVRPTRWDISLENIGRRVKISTTILYSFTYSLSE